MEINLDLKLKFRTFCSNEFKDRKCRANENNNSSWFYVQAGTKFGDKLHYEFYNGKVQFHIESEKYEELQKFLFESIVDKDLKWEIWNKPNYCCKLEM